MRTEDLLNQLTADLKPVRRVAPPALAALGWIAIAVAVVGVAVAVHGLRDDLGSRATHGLDLPQMGLAGLTGVLAAFAAFQLALPDRDRRWALLPLPAAALWMATVGLGCLGDVLRHGWSGLRLETSFSCTGFILGLGLPLTASFLWFARHAAPLRPGSVAALGGLAAAAIAQTGLMLVHHLDAAILVLVWHGAGVGLVVLLARLGAPLFHRLGAPVLPEQG
ncbi:MAG TPA: NrsF family protein [Acetobacteraceae bacterium]|nr:NrsF family protein [Acetobacteraceae bacterium]